jgi:hypothetical protein
MERDILETAGQIAGLGGLALGVLLLVFRQIIAKAIFPTLTKGHAYRLLRLMTVLVFVVAIVGIGAWVYVETGGGTRISAENCSVAGNISSSDISIEGAEGCTP